MQNLSAVSDKKDIATKGYVDAVKSVAVINKSTLGYSGKNLLKNNATYTYTQNGITFTPNDDGSITVNGTATAVTFYQFNQFRGFTFDTNEEYILFNTSTVVSGVSIHIQYGTTDSGAERYQSGVKFFGRTDIKYAVIRVAAGTVCNNVKIYPMLCYADITDSTYEPYTPDVNTRLLALEDKQAQSGALLADTSIGSSSGSITVADLANYNAVWAYIDGNSNGIGFATNVIIPIAYLAKSASNSVKLAGGIPSDAYITSSGPQAPKDTSGYITAKVSGNVLSLSLSGGTIGNVKLVAM